MSLVSVSVLGEPHVQHSSATRVFWFWARRVAGRSPRREPWVRPNTKPHQPWRGGTFGLEGQGGRRAKRTSAVSPLWGCTVCLGRSSRLTPG